jgi:hypothetical protein
VCSVCSAPPDSASITSLLNYVKMAAFQFYLQSRKQRRVRWVGDGSRMFPGETGV